MPTITRGIRATSPVRYSAMNKTKKNVTYITATCKAAENKLLGSDRIRRMADSATEKEAYAVLRETSFGGGIDSIDSEDIIKAEERLLLDFVREYVPDESCLAFCLLPYDFYNAEVVTKCLYTGNDVAKFVGTEGLFTVEELINAASSSVGDVRTDIPRELISAMREARAALVDGKNGVVTGAIFKKAEYACLLDKCKHAYIREMLVDKIDAINVSVCLRSENFSVAAAQTIGGGTLTEKQIEALCLKDEKEVSAAFANSKMKDVVVSSVRAAKDFKPLVDLEKEINCGAAKRAYDGRYTEQSGTLPFTAYFLRRLYEITCVRIILSGKTNGLDGTLISKRLKSL